MTPMVSIGRFAQLARLTPRALRLYDELGLLAPACVDPGSGYRLYQLEQLEAARMIRVLRDLDLPLDDIHVYLHTSEPAKGHVILEDHRQRLARRLEATQDRLIQLDRLLKGKPMIYNVQLRSEGPRQVLFIREHVALPETAGVLKQAMDEVCALLGRRGGSAAGAPWCAYPMPEEGEQVPVDCVVPVAGRISRDGRVQAAELPATETAYTVHVGPYSALPAAFSAVAAWVADQAFEVTGPIREVYLEHDPSPAERHVVEVIFPIQRLS